jgi:translation initiation factor eIF-2B subunit gamma
MQDPPPAIEKRKVWSWYATCLLPWCFKEHSDPVAVLNPFKGTTIQALALQHSTTHVNGHKTHHNAIPLLKPMKLSPVQASRTDTPRSIPTSPISSDGQEGEYASLRVGLVLHRVADGFAARVNNIHSYMQANKHVCGFSTCPAKILTLQKSKQFLSQTTYMLPREPPARSLALISPDSIVGESTRIGEKTSIKRSVVGRHCVIGKMVKMVGCVVLDHCVVADR